MHSIENLILSTSLRCHKTIQRACAPLFHYFGINNFTYTKITATGDFYSLSSHTAWMEYYFYENFHLKQPHFRHPKNFQSGISVPHHIEDAEYTALALLANEKFNINFGVVLINKLDDAVELVGFDSISQDKEHITFMLNEVALLRKFTAHFLSENQAIIESMYENKINLIDHLGAEFATAPLAAPTIESHRTKFLESMGLSINLSKREKEILHSILAGYSASKIAARIHLSPRTVESYIGNIKNKLNCNSKSEIIQRASELDFLDLL